MSSGSSDMSSNMKSTNTSATSGEQPKAFDAKGTIGNQFTEEGALGGTAQKVGGPFSSDGAIGKQFTTEGSLGGTVQSAMGGTKDKK